MTNACYKNTLYSQLNVNEIDFDEIEPSKCSVDNLDLNYF